jgi:hypothetical protein
MLYYVIGSVNGNVTQERPKVRSYDGRNLSAPQDLVFEDAGSSLFVSPSILYDRAAERYLMWVVDISEARTNTLYRFDSTDGVHFGHKKAIRQSFWKKIWHLDVLTRP